VVWLKGGSNAQTDLGVTRPAATTASSPLPPLLLLLLLLLLTSASCVSRQLLLLTLPLPTSTRASYSAFRRISGTFRLNPRIVRKSYATGNVIAAAARVLVLWGLLRRFPRVAVSTGAAPLPAQYHSNCRNLRLLLVLLLLSPSRAVPGSPAAAAVCANHATHSSAVSSRRQFISANACNQVLWQDKSRVQHNKGHRMSTVVNQQGDKQQGSESSRVFRALEPAEIEQEAAPLSCRACRTAKSLA
jgi:hypothetical protein